MKLRALRQESSLAEPVMTAQAGGGRVLRPVDAIAPIVEWPHRLDRYPSVDSRTSLRWPSPEPVSMQAEVRAKRFTEQGVEDDRYTATIAARSAAPAALIAALAEACAAVEDLRRAARPDERVMVEIRLRG
jgi:hypothetical protein